MICAVVVVRCLKVNLLSKPPEGSANVLLLFFKKKEILKKV